MSSGAPEPTPRPGQDMVGRPAQVLLNAIDLVVYDGRTVQPGAFGSLPETMGSRLRQRNDRIWVTAAQGG